MNEKQHLEYCYDMEKTFSSSHGKRTIQFMRLITGFDSSSVTNEQPLDTGRCVFREGTRYFINLIYEMVETAKADRVREEKERLGHAGRDDDH